ncbi:transcriptional regulator, Crp/Fnr family [Magnetococcus marinus MC-1]|uniref:Transcriptional regulator, Crp/Fnr family n=1 Tax=Magnetococcus marinus (strain ATCC BAA-1437 / JCM 17883 / MC-1) TaxID=156889 RepID=A0LCJ9_MAGMM|nr:Crp/Fnr family transcriptional regulator [Magnetococcus marinus]ABK45692.1 transcriptional regulator, Crp/Fnr family [Magnetococcus marinus MC-1]
MPMDLALLQTHPPLALLPIPIQEQIVRQCQVITIPARTLVFDDGHACQALPFLLKGSIRVFKQGENGREISLYRVKPDELCIITLSCLMGGTPYPATGVTESEVEAVALPRALFLTLISREPSFRDMAFAHYSSRLAELMQLVEAVTFQKLDQRLAEWLVQQEGPILVSHQQMADELGSVREMISRLLKQFEANGWIVLGRKQVEIVNRSALLAYKTGTM